MRNIAGSLCVPWFLLSLSLTLVEAEYVAGDATPVVLWAVFGGLVFIWVVTTNFVWGGGARAARYLPRLRASVAIVPPERSFLHRRRRRELSSRIKVGKPGDRHAPPSPAEATSDLAIVRAPQVDYEAILRERRAAADKDLRDQGLDARKTLVHEIGDLIKRGEALRVDELGLGNAGSGAALAALGRLTTRRLRIEKWFADVAYFVGAKCHPDARHVTVTSAPQTSQDLIAAIDTNLRFLRRLLENISARTQ